MRHEPEIGLVGGGFKRDRWTDTFWDCLPMLFVLVGGFLEVPPLLNRSAMDSADLPMLALYALGLVIAGRGMFWVFKLNDRKAEREGLVRARSLMESREIAGVSTSGARSNLLPEDSIRAPENPGRGNPAVANEPLPAGIPLPRLNHGNGCEIGPTIGGINLGTSLGPMIFIRDLNIPTVEAESGLWGHR